MDEVEELERKELLFTQNKAEAQANAQRKSQMVEMEEIARKRREIERV